MSKRALITGITGQDGAYLAQLLLDKGYRVHGTYRPTSSLNVWRLKALGIDAHPDLHLVEHDLTDLAGAFGLLEQADPDEIYNLAAQSFVGLSFKQPISTAHVTGIGALNLLEAVRIVKPAARFWQASSSEMFGGHATAPQDESTPLAPRSPYAVAKCFAHMATLNYRDSFGLYAAAGILFNHESPLRSPAFVTRKVSQCVAKIVRGQIERFTIGNLNAERDWGYAPEFVDGIWRMLQQEKPDTYVLATGRVSTVRAYVEACFVHAGMQIWWQGSGVDEKAIDRSSGKVRVTIDPNLYRPTDLDRVEGDPRRARERLGWSAIIESRELAGILVDADLKEPPRIQRGSA